MSDKFFTKGTTYIGSGTLTNKQLEALNKGKWDEVRFTFKSNGVVAITACEASYILKVAHRPSPFTKGASNYWVVPFPDKSKY